MFNAFFDVHVWPNEGRILMVNHIGFGTVEPTLTFMTVGVTTDSPSELWTATLVVGCALVKAGEPIGTLIEHQSDGSMVELHPESLATLDVLRTARVAV